MACDEDRKRENSFVDLQRFGVGVAALMLAESVKLEPKKNSFKQYRESSD